MNKLAVGQFHFENLSENFLIVDDGGVIDGLDLPARRKITEFDFTKHTVNPLKDMRGDSHEAYLRRCHFIDVLDAFFPAGEDTLTKATFLHQVLVVLSDNPKRLDGLIEDTKDTQYAYQKIQRLLLSPVIKAVLTGSENRMSFKGTVLVRLDRAKLGDFDCLFLGNLLISLYPGQVVLPAWGFYQCAFHTSLIRQGRLIAGVHSLDEIPDFKLYLPQFELTASRCTPKDAEILAPYLCKNLPHTDGYDTYMKEVTGLTG